MDKRINKRWVLSILLLCSFLTPPAHTVIYLVGDSTMANKEVKAFPETGWGMPFRYFFDSTVEVDNRAKNGRSTRTFIEEGLWQPIVSQLHPGDYVLVQFGHNDEVKEKKSYTTPDEFTAYLRRYVSETRNKGAFPVLITPVSRRSFDEHGTIKDTHAAYSELVRSVAREQNVPLIDLDQKSMSLLQQLGPEQSRLLFNYLEPGEHPNYPAGKQDDTHFSELGARRMAELVLSGIRELHLPLEQHIAQVKAAK